MTSTSLRFDKEIPQSTIVSEAYPESKFWNKCKSPYIVIPEKKGKSSVYPVVRDSDRMVMKEEVMRFAGEVQRCIGIIRPDNRKFALLEVERVDSKTKEWVRSFRLVEAGEQLLASGGCLEYDLSFSSKMRLRVQAVRKVGDEGTRIDKAMKPEILKILPSIEEFIYGNTVDTTSLLRDGKQVFVDFDNRLVPLRLFRQASERLFAEKHLFTPGSLWYRRGEGAKWNALKSTEKLPQSGAVYVRRNFENVAYISLNGVVVAVEVTSVSNSLENKKSPISFITYYYVPFNSRETPTQILEQGSSSSFDGLPLSREEKSELTNALIEVKIRDTARQRAKARVQV